MIRKITILFAALSLAAFGLAACGGDDSTSDTTAAATTTEETTATDTGSSGGAGGSIDVSADPNGALAYTTGDLSTKAGAVEINFDNPAALEHDVRIESSTGPTSAAPTPSLRPAPAPPST